MDYKELNDNELVYLCCENNEYAENLIIEKYKPCVLSILKSFLKEYNIIGMEVADLYQEGLIGLISAIKSYKENKDTTFYTYATTCIKSTMISAMRHSFRQKSRILNNSYSLDKLIEDSNNSFYDLFKDESNDPTKILLKEEETTDLINNIKSKLSKGELVVFELRLRGLKNEEIADLISKDKKYVENTMYRINKKYKEIN